jgi:hypothetical protein
MERKGRRSRPQETRYPRSWGKGYYQARRRSHSAETYRVGKLSTTIFGTFGSLLHRLIQFLSVARWNLPSLNYRRGIRRIYLVLCALWIALAVTASVSEMPQRPIIPTASASDPHRSRFGDLPSDTFDALAVERKEEQVRRAANYNQDRADYWKIRAAWAFAPPVIGYFVLFVLPASGRGTRK